MKNKYSIKGLLALTALIGIAVSLQLRVDRNIALIQKEVADATSQMHADTLPYSTTADRKTVVSITGTDIDFTFVELLLFRRRLKVNYKILTNVTRMVAPEYTIGKKDSTVFGEQEYWLQIPRTATASAGPFGYNIE